MPRVLITRSPHQASELAERLRALSIEPILIPTIELAEPTTFAPLDAALARLASNDLQPAFHWLLFTSANAVEAFHRRLVSNQLNSVILSGASHSERSEEEEAQSKDPQPSLHPTFPPEPLGHPSPEATLHPAAAEQYRSTPEAMTSGDELVSQGFSLGSHSRAANRSLVPGVYPLPKRLKIAAIGPATARALETIGLHPDLIPPQAVAESLAAALLPYARQPDATPTRFLLIRAEAARDHLPETLRATGAEVTIAPAYRTIVPAGSIAQLRSLFSDRRSWPEAITFTSSSTAQNLRALLETANLTLPPDILRLSIGPITSETLRSLNLPPHAEAAEPTVAALAAAVTKALARAKEDNSSATVDR